MSDDPFDPSDDPFKPPAIPTAVSCLHCGEEFDSYLIEWRVETLKDGTSMGLWCCPTPGCDGKGFGCDIFPLDPDYVDENGDRMWTSDEDEEDESEDDDFDDFDGDEPHHGNNGDQQDIPF